MSEKTKTLSLYILYTSPNTLLLKILRPSYTPKPDQNQDFESEDKGNCEKKQNQLIGDLEQPNHLDLNLIEFDINLSEFWF